MMVPTYSPDNINGAKYGNIGRCLQLTGNVVDALICYKKSIQALRNEVDSGRLSNRAYAHQWIAECLKHEEEYLIAQSFAVSGENMLASISPSRVRKMSELRLEIQSMLPPSDQNNDLSSANRDVKKWISSNS